MSDLLSIGASGVRAYQTALTTVSENIANSGDSAYVRRSATMSEITTSVDGRGTVNGMGVVVSGVARSSNDYTNASVRSAGADLAKTESAKVWLQRIETGLGSANLTGQMTAFFSAGTALAAEPTSAGLRAGMLSAANSVADAFATTAKQLNDANVELASRGQQATSELTRLNQAMLKVNQGLGRSQPGSAAAAQLADQRDSILEQMSALTDVNVQLDSIGRATVRGGGADGAVLVDLTEASGVGFAMANGNVALTVTRTGSSALLQPGGGALAGMAEGAQRIQGALDTLSTTASDFVSAVNTIQTGGDTATGTAAPALFTPGNPATSFTVAITDGNQIAAAARGGGTRDASNLTTLANARSSGAFEARLQSLVTDNAATLKQRDLVSAAQTAIHDGAVTARSEVSGVNLDSEAVDLVRFQQAYQASSRVIQVARETFQSIIGIQ